MKAAGMIKTTLILLTDLLIFFSAAGTEIGFAVICIIFLYAVFGGHLDLLRERAVKLERTVDRDKNKLQRACTNVLKRVKEKTAAQPSVTLYLIPSDRANAYAYGMNKIAVTKGLLDSCDDLTVQAIIAHEVGHLVNMDAEVNRVLFGTITAVILYLSIMAFMMASFLWIVFLILCMIGIFGGFVSFFVMRGLSKAVHGLFTWFQKGIVVIYQICMGAISRSNEFNADRFSANLGYGTQLKYFLQRFSDENDRQPERLLDVLYDSHPSSYERIQRIETEVTTS